MKWKMEIEASDFIPAVRSIKTLIKAGKDSKTAYIRLNKNSILELAVKSASSNWTAGYLFPMFRIIGDFQAGQTYGIAWNILVNLASSIKSSNISTIVVECNDTDSLICRTNEADSKEFYTSLITLEDDGKAEDGFDNLPISKKIDDPSFIASITSEELMYAMTACKYGQYSKQGNKEPAKKGKNDYNTATLINIDPVEQKMNIVATCDVKLAKVSLTAEKGNPTGLIISRVNKEESNILLPVASKYMTPFMNWLKQNPCGPVELYKDAGKMSYVFRILTSGKNTVGYSVLRLQDNGKVQMPDWKTLFEEQELNERRYSSDFIKVKMPVEQLKDAIRQIYEPSLKASQHQVFLYIKKNTLRFCCTGPDLIYLTPFPVEVSNGKGEQITQDVNIIRSISIDHLIDAVNMTGLSDENTVQFTFNVEGQTTPIFIKEDNAEKDYQFILTGFHILKNEIKIATREF